MKTRLRIKIDGTSLCCQRGLIPEGAQKYTEYPTGTCPHYRQYPNGEQPMCLLFQEDVRTWRILSRNEAGFAMRVPECLHAEEQSGIEREVLVEVVVGDHKTCEAVPIIDQPKEHPWIKRDNGYPILYYPDQICGYYVTYPGGSSWCRWGNTLFSRTQGGFTRRLSICLKAEAAAKSTIPNVSNESD